MDSTIDPEDRLLLRLLRHEAEAFAFKHKSLLASQSVCPQLEAAEAAAMLNVAERYSRQTSEAARLRCLLLCGLIWEHRQAAWAAAPGFIMNLLSRIGLNPAMPMVDRGYQKGSDVLSTIGDPHIETSIAARAALSEVPVGAGHMALTEFQHDVWHAIDRHARLGISAPTSAGKSHVLAYKIVEILQREPGEVVFVVPTLSLINQVTRDLRLAAKSMGASNLTILQSVSAPQPTSDSVVYVLTQERAQSALRLPDRLRRIRLLIVDEVQNIERVSERDDDRSRTLYDVINDFESERQVDRIVVSGPRVGNMPAVVTQLFGSGARSITAELPPVVNLTYTFEKLRKKVVLTQHSPVPNLSLELEFGPATNYPANVFGRKRYTESVLATLAATAKIAAQDGSVLIFSPTSGQASKTAVHIADLLKEEGYRPTPGAASLADYAARTVHPNYALHYSAQGGVLYHHGRVPAHIRGAVELAFAAQAAPFLVCTTTLMQGVNLPAKTIVALNPYLHTGGPGQRVNLTGYEFGNLRGRAGRLLKDFVGRSIALDQTSFDKEGIEFAFPEKELRSGFSDRFRDGRKWVETALHDASPPSKDVPVSDIVVYIRQSILRLGSQAKERLRRVGIELTEAEFEATRSSLARLSVPADVCSNSQYWDPIELDKVYVAFRAGAVPLIPESPFASGFVDRMLATIRAMIDTTPYYSQKYLNDYASRSSDDERALKSLMIAAGRWCREDELNEIISWGGAIDTAKIDKRVDQVLRTVAVNVPKLLRPLAKMQEIIGRPTQVLSVMESGTCEPLTRRLVDLGLARDVAIRLRRILPPLPIDEMNESVLRALAIRSALNLQKWDREQVFHFLSAEPVEGTLLT